MTKRDVVRVRDVMSGRFIMAEGLESVRSAMVRLKASDARCVIVQKRNPQDEYGIVLLSDVAKRIIGRDRSPDRVNVYEVMSKPVVSVRPDMDIRYTARLFDSFGLAVAPVMEGDEILGIVAYSDIVIEGLQHM